MRARRALPAVLLLVVASVRPASAADVPIAGDTTVPAYKIVRLKVELPKGSAVVWDVFPDPTTNVPDVYELDGGRMLMTGPPGRYVVKARVVSVTTEGGIRIDSGSVVVTIGTPPVIPPGPPQPNPNPGPTPAPPAVPADLLAKLQLAYQAEASPTKAADARTLSAAFRQCVPLASVPAYLTRSDLVAAAHARVSAAMSDPPAPTSVTMRLYGVRRAAGDWLNATLGTGAQDPLTPDLRARHATAWAAVADALDLLR